jgi:hypothetical protein
MSALSAPLVIVLNCFGASKATSLLAVRCVLVRSLGRPLSSLICHNFGWGQVKYQQAVSLNCAAVP